MNLDLFTGGLSLATLAAGFAAILADYNPTPQRAFNLLKPLTTSLIIIIVARALLRSHSGYAGMLTAALAFSLAGDVLLMLPVRFFLLGILSFSVTHSLYFVAFTSASGVALIHPLALVLAVFAVTLTSYVWQGVNPSLRIPVIIYAVLITAMAAQATGAAIAQRNTSATVAALGAVLFFVSDALVAIERFRTPFGSAPAAVLSSYWLGQWLIAISATLGHPAA